MKIFIAILETIGDVILGTCLVRNLKIMYPGCHITFATGFMYKEVLESNPDIDVIVEAIPRNMFDLYSRTNSQNYDKILLPLMTNHEDTLWHHDLDMYPKHNLVDFYAERAGITITDRRTFVYPSILDKNHVDTLSLPKTFITMHTQTRVTSKDWPIEKFKLLASMFQNVVQVGGKEDKEIGASINLCGKLSLLQTAEVIRRSQLFIGLDSAPSFLADSMNVPHIVLMGMSTSRTSGPISGKTIFIGPNRDCEQKITCCHTHCQRRDGKPPCITTISVDTVARRIKEMLGGEKND